MPSASCPPPVSNLWQELAEYKQESTELKNQEFTIRRLEERARELEAQLVEKVGWSCVCWRVRVEVR